MNYQSALRLLDEGKKVRLPEWTGYWFKNLEPKREGDDPAKILAFTRTGDIVPGWTGAESEASAIHRTDWQEVTEGMGFDFAILALKAGKKVCRAGWNGKGMWLQQIKATEYQVEVKMGHPRQLPWIGMKTADHCFVPWLASQTDMLATDWEIADIPATA